MGPRAIEMCLRKAWFKVAITHPKMWKPLRLCYFPFGHHMTSNTRLSPNMQLRCEMVHFICKYPIWSQAMTKASLRFWYHSNLLPRVSWLPSLANSACRDSCSNQPGQIIRSQLLQMPIIQQYLPWRSTKPVVPSYWGLAQTSPACRDILIPRLPHPHSIHKREFSEWCT